MTVGRRWSGASSNSPESSRVFRRPGESGYFAEEGDCRLGWDFGDPVGWGVERQDSGVDGQRWLGVVGAWIGYPIGLHKISYRTLNVEDFTPRNSPKNASFTGGIRFLT